MINPLIGQIKLKLNCTSGGLNKINFDGVLKMEAWLEGFKKYGEQLGTVRLMIASKSFAIKKRRNEVGGRGNGVICWLFYPCLLLVFLFLLSTFYGLKFFLSLLGPCVMRLKPYLSLHEQSRASAIAFIFINFCLLWIVAKGKLTH